MPVAEDEFPRSADPIDQATVTDETFLKYAKAEHARRVAAAALEPADEDAEGNRYCLDCGSLISEERRLVIPTAVRCVDCLTRRERRIKLARQTGGISSRDE
ncbi:TraR/DksA family transcriptional regulator [Thiomonas sp.]